MEGAVNSHLYSHPPVGAFTLLPPERAKDKVGCPGADIVQISPLILLAASSFT